MPTGSQGPRLQGRWLRSIAWCASLWRRLDSLLPHAGGGAIIRSILARLGPSRGLRSRQRVGVVQVTLERGRARFHVSRVETVVEADGQRAVLHLGFRHTVPERVLGGVGAEP